ncbi:MAG TPA: S1 RNA-binding domain-containing protein [Tepidisphaeraceae bacterium]|nr:S1 RNA-binding domain-containing protein [Tepidisphaeraceae bacterium]
MSDDQLKEKFRPNTDAALEEQVNAALAGVSLEALYDKSEADRRVEQTGPAQGPKRGRVVSVDQIKGEVFIDFGGKSQGIAQVMQFQELPAVGAEMEFTVDRYDAAEGLLIVMPKGALSSQVTWENLEVGQIVEGTVTGMNKGGLELQIKTMRGFMPSGQVALFFEKDISVYLGQKLAVEVIQFDRGSQKLVVSRKTILEREKEAAKQKAISELAEGMVVRGTIRSVLDYGAFVDLGGLDGLLHVSEITHRRGSKPSDFVKVGDVVDVKIIKFDRETGKLSLSLKQMMADPWVGAENKYAVGSEVTGRVARLAPFGAFVEVEEGLEGLLPISEMSWNRIKHPGDVVKEGDTIKLVVISLEADKKKVSFSLKQAGPNPWGEAVGKYAVDTTVTGTVSRLVDFGAFVELEPGLEGLIHISELSDQRVRASGDAVQVGQQIEVRVLEVDAKTRRVSLSLKQAGAKGDAARAALKAAADKAEVDRKKREEKRKGKALKGGLEF